jgi:hypothetical protein
VTIAGSTFSNCRVPIQIRGVSVFTIQPPESDLGPFRLSGIFHDSAGKQSLQIIENEWRSFSSNWDVEAIGGVITIRDNPGHISLKMCVNIPGELIFERIDMQFRQFKIEGDLERLRIGNKKGWGEFRNVHVSNAGVAISFN